MTRKEIFKAIDDEREYQTEKYGVEFDSENSPNDWISYITAYAGRGYSWNRSKDKGAEFKSAMVKVAALAVAALETI